MKLPTATTKKKARILIYDLEVSPTLGWTYGLWDTRVIKVEKQPEIMSISWRWYGDKKIHHLSMADENELGIVKTIRELFDEADIVVAHNANKFDNKVATASFLRYDLAPPSPYKTVDTLRVARGIAKLGSNSLNSLGELFGIGSKTKVTHGDLWYDCLRGDKKAWSKMKTYNNQDVELLTKLYDKLRPYINNHPNIANINGDNGCPKCGSHSLERRGVRHTNAGTYQRFRCNDCGGWCSGRTGEKPQKRPELVNYT